MNTDTVYIFTDASFDPKNKVAIIGHFFLFDSEFVLSAGNSDELIVFEKIEEKNNIRAELRSALVAINRAPKAAKVVVYTDCEAICNLPNRREKLENTKFIGQSKLTRLKNADLYEEFFDLIDSLDPEFVWVKGHSKRNTRELIQKNFAWLDRRVRKELRKVNSDR